LAAFSKVRADGLADDHSLHSRVFDEAVAFRLKGKRRRTSIEPGYLRNLDFRAIQEQIIFGLQVSGYPVGFEQTGAFTDSVEQIMSNEAHVSYYRTRIGVGEVVSNIAERSKSLKALCLLFSERLGEHPSILEIGCSQNHILKKLFKGDEYDYPIEKPRSSDIREEMLDYDGSKFNSLVNEPLSPGESFGLDILSETDDASRWARACSVRPAEILTGAMRRFVELDQVTNPNLYYIGNIDCATLPPTQLNPAHWERQSRIMLPPNNSMDVVLLSTVLYELATDEQREAMLANARSFVKPTGIIIVLDFANPDPNDSTKLKFHPSEIYAKPYQYNTLVLDMEEPDKGFQILWSWDTGRCRRMLWRPSEIGRLALNMFNRYG